jgi:hypothetical protein
MKKKTTTTKRTNTTTANYYFQQGRLCVISLAAAFADGTEVKVMQEVKESSDLSELFGHMSDALFNKDAPATRLSVEATSTYSTKEKSA